MSDYKDYFKKRRNISHLVAKKMIPKKQRKMLGSSSIWMIIVATTLAGGSGWYLSYGEQNTLDLLNRIEISIFGAANATGDAIEAKSADSAAKGEAKSATDGGTDVQSEKTGSKTWSDEEVTLFKKLDARKKQLDGREEELTKLEEELQQQKDDIEKRLAALEDVRTKIANKLEDKVKVDAQKVDTLVLMYANMKPAQAAKIIESINEDLAVEVLSKMKNKSAAEILDLMNPDTAKKISERFAGFRDPATAGH